PWTTRLTWAASATAATIKVSEQRATQLSASTASIASAPGWGWSAGLSSTAMLRTGTVAMATVHIAWFSGRVSAVDQNDRSHGGMRERSRERSPNRVRAAGTET